MAGFSLKDHLFNAESLRDFADEMSTGIPGFDADAYHATTLAGFAERELLQRLDWMADCLEPYLPADFNEMAARLEAALPPPLDLQHTDNDFGRFIHAVPGILAVRHGLEHHHDRALDLLYAATKRFSMEFYIRPFINRWPDLTLARLEDWAGDANYHVRRLVSEGTRPKLPWARKVDLTAAQTCRRGWWIQAWAAAGFWMWGVTLCHWCWIWPQWHLGKCLVPNRRILCLPVLNCARVRREWTMRRKRN